MQSQMNRPTVTSGGSLVGLLLVLAGVYFLIARYLPFDIGQYGWPLFVVLTGATILVVGMSVRAMSGLVIPGSVVTVIGLILAVQNTFSLWATWSYAWALAFPGAIGLGIAIQGMIVGNRNRVRAGARTMSTGVVLFLVFGAFFEGILHVSGYDLGSVGDLLIPLALIASGVVLIVIRLFSGRPGAGSQAPAPPTAPAGLGPPATPTNI
jgi:hypothetical protein